MGKLASEFSKPCQLTLAGLFVLAVAMRFPEPLESYRYGNPEDVLAAKQAHEARQSERQRKAGTLRCKPGWSAARRAAEALFAPEPVQASCQGIPRNEDHPGDRKDSL